jgi:hypothetical protein
MDEHIGAPSTSTSAPRSFLDYPWSSSNTESYTSSPPHRSPPSAAATPVRMSHHSSPRLLGGSPRAQPCHAGPPSPTDVVAATLITYCPSGSQSWPRPGWASRVVLASWPSRRHVALGRIAAQDCAAIFFSFLFIKLEISEK